MASEGVGPRYCLILGRASYKDEWLDEWLVEQTRPPSRERDCPLTQPADGEDKVTPGVA
jgi:hypothetical protein